MTQPESMSEEERQKAIARFREYCKVDTWAMVRLIGTLRNSMTEGQIKHL